MDEALICAGVMHVGRGNHPTNLSDIGAVMARAAGIRHLGSIALELAYLAAGRFDGLVERWLKSWDIAAGIVLVREAGGFVTDARGLDTMLVTGDIVAGNEYIQRGIVETLKQA